MREEVAAKIHTQWSGWMRYLFSKCEPSTDGSMIIPAWAVERWQRQMNTDYEDLPAEEKVTDLREADEMLKVITQVLAETIGYREEEKQCNT